MKKIKSIITAVFHSLLHRAPEALLIFFSACLIPILIMGLWHIYSWVRGAFADTDTFLRLAGENLASVAVGALCLAGSAFLFIVIMKSRGNLWAVARKMILEALHRKVVIILLLFFIILMPSLPFILETEGSLRSQVQIVITYSMGLSLVLLSVLAVFVCTASVCSEIEKKQVHITDTKPLMRWQFLLGKLMGVTILCGVLLFLMTGSVYGIIRYMTRGRSLEGMTQWEAREKQIDLIRVHEEVLVARHTVKASPPDVRDAVERRLQEKRQRGEIHSAPEEAQAREQITGEEIRRRTTAAPQGTVSFTFTGLDPNSEEPIYLRARPHMTNPDAAEIQDAAPGVWRFLRPEGNRGGELQLREIGAFQQDLTPGSFQEIPLHPDIVDRNGVVRVIFQNLRPDTGIQFSSEDGLEIMQKRGSFLPNFYRSVLIILANIVLLASISIMLGAMFSFPVASFSVAALMVMGLLGPWVAEHALYVNVPEEMTIFQYMGYTARWLVIAIIRAILAVVPRVGRFSPIERLANGRLIGLGDTAMAVGVMVFLQGGIAMMLAAYFYWKRELAKIIA